MPQRLLSPPHVLVVDGDSRARADIAAHLAAEGARVTEAKGSDEAMRLVAGRRFDAAIVDYGVPSVGGVVLVVLVRGLGNGRDLPFIVTSALTGGALEQARAHAARVPGTSFLDKPVDRHRLAMSLHTLLATA
jgi:two-component system phosphate regulon response regulator OmpR